MPAEPPIRAHWSMKIAGAPLGIGADELDRLEEAVAARRRHDLDEDLADGDGRAERVRRKRWEGAAASDAVCQSDENPSRGTALACPERPWLE